MLAERRPSNDRVCLEGMLRNANLTVTAYHDDTLIGIARSVTDFHYCCYLSDLAVDKNHQRRGVGRQLVRMTKRQLGEKCRIILLSAPQAVDYYPKLGFTKHPQSWVLEPGQTVQ
jgi:ribosomal protein S18 acetylase RimI-like enzyme